jgi:hypothetical protein
MKLSEIELSLIKSLKILPDFEKVIDIIAAFEHIRRTVANSKKLLYKALPYLKNIKKVLGRKNDIYLLLSSALATEVIKICKEDISQRQEDLVKSKNELNDLVENFQLDLLKLMILKQVLNNSWELMKAIDKMDLNKDVRNSYIQCCVMISDLKKQVPLDKPEAESNIWNVLPYVLGGISVIIAFLNGWSWLSLIVGFVVLVLSAKITEFFE